MYDLTDAKNMAELVEHLKLYNNDHIDIMKFYEGGELPDFIKSGRDAIKLADLVVGATSDELEPDD